jgi:guanylate kinase
VFPPSYAELRRRLVSRRQDDEVAIELRLKNAVQEMREYAEFDFVIINDRLEEATRALGSVVAAARMRPFRMRAGVQAILEEFEHAVEREE